MKDQRVPDSKLWVRLDEADLTRLDGSASGAGVPSFTEVMRQEGKPTRSEVWELVRGGKYLAYRIAQGRRWEWRLKSSDSDEQRVQDIGRC